MITPVNTVLLSLEKTLQDEIVLNGGLKLFLDPDYNIEWNATVTGKVAGLPSKPTGDCSDVVSRLHNGDEVAFTYRVVSDRTFGKAGNYFMPTMSDNPYQKRFIDSENNRLFITAMPPAFNKFNKLWVGLLVDKGGKHLDGTQGNEKEVERWLSGFKFSGTQDLAFNNLIKTGDQNLWRCQFTEILAVKNGEDIIAVNDRVICEPVEENYKHKLELQLKEKLPYQDIKLRYMDRGKLISGAEEMGFNKGDIVAFEENYIEKYDLWGKQYFLVKKKRLLGKWQ